MNELNNQEVDIISGGKNILSKVVNIVGGCLITGVIEGVVGFAVAGPAGFVVGFGHGTYEGVGGRYNI